MRHFNPSYYLKKYSTGNQVIQSSVTKEKRELNLEKDLQVRRFDPVYDMERGFGFLLTNTDQIIDGRITLDSKTFYTNIELTQQVNRPVYWINFIWTFQVTILKLVVLTQKWMTQIYLYLPLILALTVKATLTLAKFLINRRKDY